MTGIRLLWSSHSSAVGGAELALVELLEVAVEAGLVDQALVLLPDAKGPLVDRLRALPRVDHAVAPMAAWMTHEQRSALRSYRRHAKNIWVARGITQVIRAFRPDLAITNTLTTPSLAIAARATATPHRWFAHESGDLHHLHLGHGTWRRIGAWGDGLLAPSLHLAGQLAKHIDLPMTIVRPIVLRGAAGHRAVADDPGTRRARLLVVGDARPSKGVLDAIAAAGLAARQMLLELTVVSAPDGRLREAIATAGLADHARFVTPGGTLQELYRTSDLLICPSRSETFGRLPAEALWEGCRVIVNDLPAWREWIPEGAATFVDTGDHVALADAVRQSLQRPLGFTSAHDALLELLGPEAARAGLERALTISR